MGRLYCLLSCFLVLSSTVGAQTLSFKADHIYLGRSGNLVAVTSSTSDLSTSDKPPVSWIVPSSGIGTGFDVGILLNEGAGNPTPYMPVPAGRVLAFNPSFQNIQPPMPDPPAAWDPNGIAIPTDGNWCSLSSGNIRARFQWVGNGITYGLPQTQGTVIVQYRPSFNAADGVDRFFWGALKDYFADFPWQGFTFSHESNSVRLGWVWGSGNDHRVSFPATGLWQANDRIQLALTWDTQAATTANAYLNGALKASRNAALITGDTGNATNVGFFLGGLRWRLAFALNCTSSSAGVIEFLYVWNRALSASEIDEIWNDPYSMWQPQ